MMLLLILLCTNDLYAKCPESETLYSMTYFGNQGHSSALVILTNATGRITKLLINVKCSINIDHHYFAMLGQDT